MRFQHRSAILLLGLLWLLMGMFLLYKGLFYAVFSTLSFSSSQYPLLGFTAKYLKDVQTASMVLIFLGLLVGLVKGRTVLAKSAKRSVNRLLLIPSPLNLKDVFPLSYLILIGGMMLLGLSLKVFKLPFDIRGFIDIAVGAALVNGAIVYFKLLSLLKTRSVRKDK